MTVDDKVMLQTELFWKEVPRLIKEGHQGKWVVFHEGEVRGIFDIEEEAYQYAIEQFGLEGGQVIAPVENPEPTPISASFLYGIA